MKNFEFRISNCGNRAPSILFAGVLFFVDQLVRIFFVFSDRYFCNTLGPWGVSVGGMTLFFLDLLLIAAFGFALWKSDARSESVAIAMIFSGGLSNLSDRIFFGCVRDFLVIPWFPSFNLGDVYLTVGAVMLFLLFFPFLGEKTGKEVD